MIQKAPTDRKFGVTFSVIFLLLGLWFAWKEQPAHIVLFAFSAITATITFIRPGWLSPLNKKWMAFGMFLQRYLNPVVMGTIYLLVFSTLGLFVRIARKNNFQLDYEPDSSSYWIKTAQNPQSSMKDQF